MCSRIYYLGLCKHTLAQRRNRLTTHFSENISVIKRRIYVLKLGVKAPESREETRYHCTDFLLKFNFNKKLFIYNKRQSRNREVAINPTKLPPFNTRARYMSKVTIWLLLDEGSRDGRYRFKYIKRCIGNTLGGYHCLT